MKTSSILKIALVAMPLLLGSCGTKKKVVEETKPAPADSTEQKTFLTRVNSTAQTAKFITSKVKFSVEYGQQDIALTGNLRMKRDDVIRLQLMAFGFVEAARIEFTKDYVLIMDRINKQYLKAPYMQIDFLRNSGLNFYSLQALFWKAAASLGGEDVVISLEEGKMNYSWLASDKTGQIKMANILYKDRFNGNSQLNWDYRAFERLESNNKEFPSDMLVTLNTQGKEVKLGIKLSYIKHETDWETRTEVSNKYREVTVEDILRRFMAL